MSDKLVQILEGSWLLLVLPLLTGAAVFLFYLKPVLLLPFILLILLGGAWLVSRFELQTFLLKFIALSLPFSIEVALPGNSKMFLPTEPLIGIVALSVLLEFLRKPGFVRDFIGLESKWVLPLILVFLITIPFSTMAVVSVKFSLVNITYIAVFLLFVKYQLRLQPKLIHTLMALYSVGLFLVLIYALMRYSEYGWNPAVVKGIFLPFYRDHTILGATAAIIAAYWLVYAGHIKVSSGRILAFFAGLGFICAVLLSGSRAAIISIGFFLSVFLLLWLKVRLKHLMLLTLISAAFVLVFHKQIVEAVYSNTYVSRSQNNEWTGNLLSAGNVTTDVSNIERLNRWYSGFKMFLEKPLTGFGPGTYKFVYIPYQKKELMNRLTVKNPWNIPENSGGTAHSEYILALSEMGIFGLAALMLFLGRLFWITFVKARHHARRASRAVAFAALSTYLFHGLFNNFLNVDKFAFLFWIMAAWLLAAYENNDDERVLS
jgi:O-antigen ligase